VDFVAIDVETANADMASICQIGIASYEAGLVVEQWESHVDPEDYFDPTNVAIHGINEQTVMGAPRLPEIHQEIVTRLEGRVVVSHTHFDRVGLQQAFVRYGLPYPSCVWLDSARVARRCWRQFSSSGYGLANVCNFLGYEFPHHDALEDAKASGHILLSAIAQTGLSVQQWLARVERPIDASEHFSRELQRPGNPPGPLFGEVLVFTGTLQIPRREAADLADLVGCEVAAGVTKKTTMLVVGDQDVKKLAGHEKSSKHRKAEELNAQGQAIRILRESDFLELVALITRDGQLSGEQRTG
jgi:DNA polymerase III subunit epsilon